MSEEKKEQKKITCSCGSVIFEKNMLAHSKTKKHQVSLGASTSRAPSRSKSHVNFAQAQQSTRADVDDELSEQDLEEEEEEEDAEEVLEEVLIILESLDQRVNAIEAKIDSVVKTLQILSQKSDTNFERIEETRLKTLSCMGELREISFKLSRPAQLNAVDPFGVTVSLEEK